MISVSAVGSLREELAPRSVVIPDQLIDRTRGQRPATFFGDGLVVHVSLAEPFCPVLSSILVQAARTTGPRVHSGGTLVVIEGPQFSTRAESKMFRSWGGGIIGMTIAWMLGLVVTMATAQMKWPSEGGLATPFPIYAAILAAAFSALIGMVFGLYPALSAAKLDPIVALRRE